MGGFTLVEMLVALLIFGMLAGAGVALLSFSVRAQDVADDRLGEVARIRRMGALLTADLAQAAARVARDESGAVRPALEGAMGQDGGASLVLVRRGWDNLDGAGRPSLQKVRYALAAGRLERTAYRFVDGARPMEPIILLDDVRGLHFRYRDDAGEWRDRWDPTRITDLPQAVEMVADTASSGRIRQLFLVGPGA